MKLQQIGHFLSDQKTLFLEIQGNDIAVNDGAYVLRKDNTLYTGKLKSNNLGDVVKESSEPQQLIDAVKVAEMLGMSKNNVLIHVNNENFDKVPKPVFYYTNKSYKKYFWLSEQFN
ncbi:hypothetical protein MTQ93_09720 [Staphylococcus agnetis]|uniref:hypothetical protein n=1 Tax=Staphylococcus agnetis TaxID=985762 RepID=UPI00208F956D|nr:hypothetical protein [Staphylococcus agnetis]MCO4346322.1 hypothetical protein [Staphylococcus agnetis]MCO4360602.1 hypothetical protein [Staphylococcus agnetis]